MKTTLSFLQVVSKCCQCKYFCRGSRDTPNTCTHPSAPNREYFGQMILPPRLTPEDKDADDWIVIDTNTLKEIKFITLEYQLQFINNKIQSHCMEKDGNLIYFYTPEVSSRFGEATDMARLQLSSIVYDVALKKTTKSRWHNLTNVYFDFLNKQFYRLEK